MTELKIKKMECSYDKENELLTIDVDCVRETEVEFVECTIDANSLKEEPSDCAALEDKVEKLQDKIEYEQSINDQNRAKSI